jgi:hypothetical protein
VLTRDADAELLVHEQQVGALPLRQLNRLGLSRIEPRKRCLDVFGDILHDEP